MANSRRGRRKEGAAERRNRELRETAVAQDNNNGTVVVATLAPIESALTAAIASGELLTDADLEAVGITPPDDQEGALTEPAREGIQEGAELTATDTDTQLDLSTAALPTDVSVDEANVAEQMDAAMLEVGIDPTTGADIAALEARLPDAPPLDEGETPNAEPSAFAEIVRNETDLSPQEATAIAEQALEQPRITQSDAYKQKLAELRASNDALAKNDPSRLSGTELRRRAAAAVAAQDVTPKAPEPEPDIAARASAPSRQMDEQPGKTEESDPIAAAKAAAVAERLPAKPITLWVSPRADIRDAKSPLSTVMHKVVPSGTAKRKKPIVGGSVTAACEFVYLVDTERVTGKEFVGDTDLPKCGYCVLVEKGEEIAAYDAGRRRPILPNLAEARAATPPPMEVLPPAIEELMSDEAFEAALADQQQIIERMTGTEKWTPTAEEMEAIRTRIATIRDAQAARTRRAAAVAEAMKAPRRTRNVVRTPKQTVDGTASSLPDARANGKLLPTLFRTLDPIGPFLVGYRSAGGPQWIVRDTRVTDGSNPDAPSFKDDKAAAIGHAQSELAKLNLSVEETARLANIARGRMQAGDSLKRSR